MGSIAICLEISTEFMDFKNPEELEQNYQEIYKPLFTFLYSHSKFKVNLSFNGPQLEFFRDNHPEAIQILKELTSRHQIEILGGGYYSPVFPLLFPIDRSGQIEKYTSLLRETTGKRPRGMKLFKSIWDPSLITSFQTCGMEYVILENTLIPKNKRVFYPLIASEQGKSIKIIPMYTEFLPAENEENDTWFLRINKTLGKRANESKNGIILGLELSSENISYLIKKNWFEYVDYVCTDENASAQLMLFQQYLKNADSYVSSYIASGMSWNIAQWSQKPYAAIENKTHFPVTIHDYLNNYSFSHTLYERIMYVSMIINQIHGDKMRKNAARERLWEAQFGQALVSTPKAIPIKAQLRQNAFKALNEAEKILRECEDFKESVNCFDYNFDGMNEYICQMNKYNAVISPVAGAITQLDVFKSSCNYSDSINRIETFDGISDRYERNFFVEHLIDIEDKQKYINSQFSGNGIFSQVKFTEKKFESNRKEIHLEGRGEFSSLQQPVSLRKNFIITSNGISVQYILKNESPLSLKGCFFVESNFCKTSFNKKNFSQYVTDIIINGERKKLEVPQFFNADENVSVLQITDSDNTLSFVYEPNEECGFVARPMIFNRPDENGNVIPASECFSIAMYWNTDLAAGMEMEKTINLSMVPARKSKLK